MATATKKSKRGTSFHGTYITTTPKKLKQLFSGSYSEWNDGEDKVNFEFILETKYGDVFTIYDWKEYRVIRQNEEVSFHIGGRNSSITEQALSEIEELMKLSL